MAKIDINKARCKGCEYCITVCAKKVIGLEAKINAMGIKPAVVVDSTACNGCSLCAIMCPEVCIEIWK